MALFKIFKGSSNRLGSGDNATKNTKEGFAYFTPDDGKFYIDIVDSDTPIIGSNAKSGANRICINDGGFMEGLILDCGTASGWTNITPEIIKINYDGGGATFPSNATIVNYDGGGASSSNYTIFLDGGNSYM